MRVRSMLGLAWKNIFRHGRRTIITASAIAVGLMMYIMVDGLLGGIEQESERNLIWFETGAAQVVDPDYPAVRDLRPLKHAVDQVAEVRERMEEAGIDTAARVVFHGELIVFKDPFPEDGSVNITGYGIEPETDDEVFRLPQTVAAGRFLKPGEHGALMGSWLAEDIGAEVGYPITIVTRTRQGFYQTMDLEIVGIVNTPNPLVNRGSVFIPLDVVDTYLQMEGGVTEIAVSAPEFASLNDLRNEMEQELAGLADVKVVDWRQLAADYVAIAEAKQGGTGMILFLVFVIAAVGVSNTVLMSVLERTRELGMMRAIGMNNREIKTTLLAESGMIGLLGALVGMMLGAGANLYLANVGIDYSSFFRDMDMGYRITSVVYSAWLPATFIQAFFIGIILSVVVAYVPIRRALKMKITDSLRAA